MHICILELTSSAFRKYALYIIFCCHRFLISVHFQVDGVQKIIHKIISRLLSRYHKEMNMNMNVTRQDKFHIKVVLVDRICW